MAINLAQGDQATDFLQNWCYTYLATVDMDSLVVTPEHITATEMVELTEKVHQLHFQYT